MAGLKPDLTGWTNEVELLSRKRGMEKREMPPRPLSNVSKGQCKEMLGNKNIWNLPEKNYLFEILPTRKCL